MSHPSCSKICSEMHLCIHIRVKPGCIYVLTLISKLSVLRSISFTEMYLRTCFNRYTLRQNLPPSFFLFYTFKKTWKLVRKNQQCYFLSFNATSTSLQSIPRHSIHFIQTFAQQSQIVIFSFPFYVLVVIHVLEKIVV